MKGKFAGANNLLFNAANGGVGLGKINAAVPASILARTRTVQTMMAHGTINAPTQCGEPNPNC